MRRGRSIAPDLASNDPLKFTDTKPYKSRLAATQKLTGQKDAVIVGVGRINGVEAIVASMDYSFIGGSMGVVVGEKIVRGIELALERRAPMLIVSCSGGARMMEGALSLMQMAKISAALARLDRARLPYISILTDPTTGGVTASFAMLGDLNIAEPKALIGFAGPRVIEQTIRQKLPDGFQRSEFLLERGMLDLVVDRREMKATLGRALQFMADRRDRSHRLDTDRAQIEPRRTALRARTVRHQARARQHPRPCSPALDHPRAGVALDPHRRHQRQRLGRGDGRTRAARRRPAHRAATPRRTSSAIEERVAIDGAPVDRRDLRAGRPADVLGRSTMPRAVGRADGRADLLRSLDRGRLRDLPRARTSTSPSSRSASAGGSMRPMS